MPPAAIAGTAVLGAVAGSQSDKTKSTYGIDAGPASGFENEASNMSLRGMRTLEDWTKLGPDSGDISGATTANRDFASMLDSYSKGGYAPNDQDISSSNSLAARLFQGQRLALTQRFEDQNNSFNQQAALMGRDPMDPVFRNKMMQEQTRQGSMLAATQGAYGTQLAMDSPFQRLQFKQQQAQVMGGLASQALANRQMLTSMGQNIMGNERQFRLGTASKFGEQESGGGLKGAIMGGMAGLGAGAKMAGGFGG